VATACLFLAGKVEETPKPLKEVIRATVEVRYSKNTKEALDSLKDPGEVERRKEHILSLERSVLSCLGFDFRVDHPYKYVLRYIKEVIAWSEQTPGVKSVKSRQKEIAQVAWNFVNDSLRTTVSVQYDAKKVAIAVIYLAVKFLKVNSLRQHSEWWVNLMGNQRPVDVREENALLEVISDQILDLYEKKKKALKDKGGKPDDPALIGKNQGQTSGGARRGSKPGGDNDDGKSDTPASNTPPKLDEESLKGPSPRSEDFHSDVTKDAENDVVSGKNGKANEAQNGRASADVGMNPNEDMKCNDSKEPLKRPAEAIGRHERTGDKRIRVE